MKASLNIESPKTCDDIGHGTGVTEKSLVREIRDN